MFVLHIEHAVPDFTAWKQAFDSDPVGRKQLGVRRYQVTRPVDNANYAIIDLEFDTQSQAEGAARGDARGMGPRAGVADRRSSDAHRGGGG